MNWKKLLSWLWNHYGELIAAGHTLVDFVTWAAAGIEALLKKTPNGTIEEVTDEMFQELKDSWVGPLAAPDEVFPPEE